MKPNTKMRIDVLLARRTSWPFMLTLKPMRRSMAARFASGRSSQLTSTTWPAAQLKL